MHPAAEHALKHCLMLCAHLLVMLTSLAATAQKVEANMAVVKESSVEGVMQILETLKR